MPNNYSSLLPPDPIMTKKYVTDRLGWGRVFWKPLHDRQDYWMTMYKLMDPVQASKPMNYRRFISNDPRTAVDAGVSILTRNDPFWRIDMPYGMNQAEREKVGTIERALAGIVDDLDEMFVERFEPNFWTQAAWFALNRGEIWGKFHVSKAGTKAGRASPLLANFWDGRFVYPNFDGIGLESVCAEVHTTINEILMQYGGRARTQWAQMNLNPETLDPNTPAMKVEFWSNDRTDDEGTLRPGIYGVLGYYSTSMEYDGVREAPMNAIWLIPPMYHEYAPDELPVVGVPVNGIPLKQNPLYGTTVLNNMNQRARRLGMILPTWHDPSGATSEWGRGLLSSVEELMPQYNELVATALQHFGLSTYPTWVFNTQTGELPDFQDGINAKVPLRIGEQVQQFQPQPINQDAWRLLEILNNERERGTLNSILQANGGLSAQSGVVLQQNVNAALNNLQPFGLGLTNFGTAFGSHVLSQLRNANSGILNLVARSGSRSYFRIEFDPKTDLEDRKYKPVPIFRPAVPEDLLLKAQVARLLLDPRMPITSVLYVLEKVFQLEDPEGEGKRMLEDIANRDPILLLSRIADILREEGEDAMADRIEQKEFQAKFQEQAQMQQLSAQVQAIMAQMQGGQGGSSLPGGGAGTGQEGLASTSGSPESTGAGQPRPGQGGAPTTGGNPGAGLGAIGG